MSDEMESDVSSKDEKPARTKRRYTGKSRTTKWRKKKKGVLESSSESEELSTQSTDKHYASEPSSSSSHHTANHDAIDMDVEQSPDKTRLEELSTQSTAKHCASEPSSSSSNTSLNHDAIRMNIEQSPDKTRLEEFSTQSTGSDSEHSPSNSSSPNERSPSRNSDTSSLHSALGTSNTRLKTLSNSLEESSADEFHVSVEEDSSDEDSSGISTSDKASSGSEYFPSSDSESRSCDNFSSDLECLEAAHYLDEEPEDGPQNHGDPEEPDPDDPEEPDPHDPEDSDPDDPDDPDNRDDPSDESSSEESDGENQDNVPEVASFTNNRLNVNLRLNQNLTKGEVICLQLACAVRHRTTFENIIDQFKNLNMLFGPGVFPESKSKLWSDILLNKRGIQLHVYCGRRNCGQYINRKDRIIGVARCRCGYEVPVERARFFVTLDLPTQLKHFLSMPGIWEKLQNPQQRQKVSPTAIEDIYDGEVYIRMKNNGGPLSDPHNFSYIFNFDACTPMKHGTLKVVPLYIRINELPQEIRQKFHFPVAVYVDHCEPNPQSFLRPFVRQARRLATRGIAWRPDGENQVTSRFFPLGFNVDSPVRYAILRMSKWDSAYGCTYCTNMGVRQGGSQRYPCVHVNDIPPFHNRTHQGMIDAMIHVEENDDIESFEGHKGASILMLLTPYLNLREGQAEDDLHQDHEGSAADVTELLLTTRAARVDENMSKARLLRIIDSRLLTFKTPGRISRKPRSIKKRHSWKGTEWRNWLLFYAIPCLTGLIKPEYLDILASLSNGCYLLSQDAIEPGDINTAEERLDFTARRFELTFGVHRIKYNFHVTTRHKGQSVRSLGNPFAYTTYNFESLNRKVIDKVTSPQGAVMQIVTRVVLNTAVNSAQYDERLSEEVRLRIEEILNPYQIQEKREVGRHLYLVGRGIDRATTDEEAEVLAREQIDCQQITEHRSFMKMTTRYWSSASQSPAIKSDDTFIYSTQDTFCTLRTIFSFLDNDGQEQCGAFVVEHDVRQVVPVSTHLSLLQDVNADLLHFLYLDQVRCPAVKMRVGNVIYATCVPNCCEID